MSITDFDRLIELAKERKELEVELKWAKDSLARVTKERDDAVEKAKVALELLRNIVAMTQKCERKLFPIVNRQIESEKKGGG